MQVTDGRWVRSVLARANELAASIEKTRAAVLAHGGSEDVVSMLTRKAQQALEEMRGKDLEVARRLDAEDV